jgi:hypothetical protein
VRNKAETLFKEHLHAENRDIENIKYLMVE